jgi:hypothetical protein
MKLIPEYGPVNKLCLSFVREFFNTRFHYGKTLCEIIRAVRDFVEIEMFIGDSELQNFREVCRKTQLELDKVSLNSGG